MLTNRDVKSARDNESIFKYIFYATGYYAKRAAKPFRDCPERLRRPSIFYANSEPQPNAKYSCAASVAITR